MHFAKAYKEEITLAYYCCNLFLTVAIFSFGTIYLRRRDRRDQQRKEWREFAKDIRGQCNTLKDKEVLSRVSKTKEKFGNVVICPDITGLDITGLDVLRNMLNSSDFLPGSTQPRSSLRELREDLDSIFQLLNTCASLTLLGPVPSNIRAELERLVTDLGEMTLPFFSGDQRRTVLKCLKYFSSDRKPAMKTEDVDKGILEKVPYIKCLRFGEGGQSSEIHYSKINKFTFKVDQMRVLAHFPALNQLLRDIEDERYVSEFAREFREHFSNPKYFDKIDSDDSDELVIAKVLHEVLMYVHLLGLGEGAIDEAEGVSLRNIEILSEVYERVTEVKPEEVIVRYTCERFIQDLSDLKKSKYSCHSCASFREELTKLYERFCDLIVITKNVSDSSPPPTSTQVETRDTDDIYNCQFESYV